MYKIIDIKKIILIVVLSIVCIISSACKSVYQDVDISITTRYEKDYYIKTAKIKNITDKRLDMIVRTTKEEYIISATPPARVTKYITSTSDKDKRISLNPMEEISIEEIGSDYIDITFSLIVPDNQDDKR